MVAERRGVPDARADAVVDADGLGDAVHVEQREKLCVADVDGDGRADAEPHAVDVGDRETETVDEMDSVPDTVPDVDRTSDGVESGESVAVAVAVAVPEDVGAALLAVTDLEKAEEPVANQTVGVPVFDDVVVFETVDDALMDALPVDDLDLVAVAVTVLVDAIVCDQTDDADDVEDCEKLGVRVEFTGDDEPEPVLDGVWDTDALDEMDTIDGEFDADAESDGTRETVASDVAVAEPVALAVADAVTVAETLPVGRTTDAVETSDGVFSEDGDRTEDALALADLLSIDLVGAISAVSDDDTVREKRVVTVSVAPLDTRDSRVVVANGVTEMAAGRETDGVADSESVLLCTTETVALGELDMLAVDVGVFETKPVPECEGVDDADLDVDTVDVLDTVVVRFDEMEADTDGEPDAVKIASVDEGVVDVETVDVINTVVVGEGAREREPSAPEAVSTADTDAERDALTLVDDVRLGELVLEPAVVDDRSAEPVRAAELVAAVVLDTEMRGERDVVTDTVPETDRLGDAE